MSNQGTVLTINETAENLGVSIATIRNWVRHNYLTPISVNDKKHFSLDEVIILKNKLDAGGISRLNNRANKRNSTKKFIPIEYAGNDDFNINLSLISEPINTYSLNLNKSILFLALKLLQKENLVYSSDIKELLSFNESLYKNKYLLKIIKEFFNQIDDDIDDLKYSHIFKLEIPQHFDILGLLYQSIKSEGEKAKQGSYYTPKNIVDEIISDYVKENINILDPCCGTGQFLLDVCDYITDPSRLYGYDIDGIAVFIAKINLIIQFKSIDFEPHIYQKDTLIDLYASPLFRETKSPHYYDLIITNPPWGLHFENGTLSSLKTIYPEIKSLESFSYFLSKSIEMLNGNGILSFILPESILNIKVHSDIRNLILKSTSILKIVKLGRAFTNVFTNVIRIDLKNEKPKKGHKIKIIAETVYSIEQERFWANPDLIFDIHVDDLDNAIIDKVYQKEYSTLKKNAEWALGIVTGDNNKFIHSIEKDGYEPIYTGKEVNKYSLTPAKCYIKFEPEIFQQVAPVVKYRACEKLIYKFISKRLVFAYDDKQRLTLNSANILIPKIKNYPTKIVLAFLNSSLFQFIYLKKFNTIKVLRGNLEELPFPHLSDETLKELVSLVDDVLQNRIEESIIDDYIMNLFQITESEFKYIRNSI